MVLNNQMDKLFEDRTMNPGDMAPIMVLYFIFLQR